MQSADFNEIHVYEFECKPCDARNVGLKCSEALLIDWLELLLHLLHGPRNPKKGTKAKLSAVSTK